MDSTGVPNIVATVLFPVHFLSLFYNVPGYNHHCLLFVIMCVQRGDINNTSITFLTREAKCPL